MHSYPGLACDVWAHSYTFSFAPNPNWSATFVNQPEIEAYLQSCVKSFGLEPHVRYNTRITQAILQEDSGDHQGQWKISTQDGETFYFDAVINAMGNQHTPIFPNIEGLERFAGPSWHSTEWNHDIDLRGKNVAIIGSAASAVQIVPQLADIVDTLYVLQRTPNWILPRNQKSYSAFRKKCFNALPILPRLLRKFQSWLMGFMHEAAMLGNSRMASFENMGRKFINKAISDPELRAAVTPESRFGCKRPLVSDDFYPALMRDNVNLLASGAQQITADGVIASNGQTLDVDVIIYCTGYQILDFERIEVVGEKAANLATQMAQAPEAYKGLFVKGFPNYFLGMGPNAVVLSVSYFGSAEANIGSIVNLLSEMRSRGVKQLRVKEDLHEQYNSWLRTQFPLFSWGAASCVSYYQTDTGQSPFLYPGNFKSFKAMRSRTSLNEFDLVT